MVDSKPEAFYDDYGAREWERLDRDFVHRLEWEATVERLEETLPSDGEVLDVGGGAGRYTIWLAERGYEVTLVEPSGTQREIAREKIAEAGVAGRVTVRDGDVRDLSLPADAVDATLCLGGPLSHVLDESDRERAASELRRVTGPGGPVVVSVMSRLAFVLMTVQYVGLDEDNGSLPVLPAMVRDGDLTGERLTEAGIEPFMADCHFFRPAEFETLLSEAGLAVESVEGLEGVGGIRRTHFDALDEDDRAHIRELNDLLRTEEAAAEVSPHMLAVCRA